MLKKIIYLSMVFVPQGMILSFIFLSLSCTEGIAPAIKYSYLDQISSDFGTAIIKQDGSFWGGPVIVSSGVTGLFRGDTLSKEYGINDAISADLNSGMAVAADVAGNLFYWGYPIWSNTMSQTITSPQKVSKLDNIKSIKFFAYEVDILRNDGSIWRITIDVADPTKYLQPVKIPGLESIACISQGLALKNDGTLIELTNTKQIFGGIVSGIKDVKDFNNVWNRRTVILKRDGSVWAWGKNDLGQLGNGTFIDSATPVQVTGLDNIVSISASYDFNLALKSDGTAWFWGFAGRDNNNKPYGYSTPVRIESLNNVTLICASYPCYFGRSDHTYWSYKTDIKVLTQLYFN